ncbi:MAG TPA: DUF4097 family beta strand repeat-containing protein [Vicinamibacterales bacterium]|nr:DUF4097 family beta strand repeat-containing protein [Vicinamibacterales bacterium]
MSLRIFLTTLAILAGLAAAPGAQPFVWQAGQSQDAALHERVLARVELAFDQLASSIELMADRLSHRAELAADRTSARVERQVQQVRARVDAHLTRHLADAGYANDGAAQTSADDPCRENGRSDNDDSYRHCEVREQRLPAGPLTVDAGRNGGIRVDGWDGNDILVRAIVQASARDEASAKQLASGVEVRAGGGHVSATGPERGGNGREWWSVSYRISVPHRTDLDLRANNGGITIDAVAGTIRFETSNGGVRLADLGGAVTGRTSNGGLRVLLGGSQWDGEGLDVETSNGGVTLSIPEPYNAQLETRTVNGGFKFDYPLTLTGELSPRRGISTAIGAGGAPVRVRTTNGGLRIERRSSAAR